VILWNITVPSAEKRLCESNRILNVPHAGESILGLTSLDVSAERDLSVSRKSSPHILRFCVDSPIHEESAFKEVSNSIQNSRGAVGDLTALLLIIEDDPADSRRTDYNNSTKSFGPQIRFCSLDPNDFTPKSWKIEVRMTPFSLFRACLDKPYHGDPLSPLGVVFRED